MTRVVIPTRMGLRYRPILSLGEGGMAEVHLAVGRGPGGFNKLVVLKAMRKQLVPDADLRRMFLGEARLSARLNHPNVVQVYEVIDTTCPCLVMEYLDGQALSMVQQIGGDRFTTAMQLRIISEALLGLHYSHELRDYDGSPLNIVHRDVSPQNIFVTYDGRVKVLDFGIAKAANVGSHTQTGFVKGKVSYMAPEQLLGEELDRRADVYAAGCLLWQAAAGVKLWSGMLEREIVRNLVDGNIPPPSSQRPVDRRLEQIVMRALALDPVLRHATALELHGAVEHYLTETRPGCTMRVVAAFVSQLFEEERGRRSETIHSALSTPDSVRPPAASDAEVSAVRRSLVTVLDGPRRRRSRKPLVVAFTALGLLAAAGAYVGHWALVRPGASEPRVPAAEPRWVEVRVFASPREASVTVDGKATPGNPAVLKVPMDARDHQIRVVASGYAPVVRVVRFESNASMDIMLNKLELGSAPSAALASDSPRSAARSAESASAATPVQRRIGSSHAADKRASCSPPFYFDRGIKVYKPECL